MIDLQAFVDGLSAGWQKERSESQLTLGGFIKLLKALSADAMVDGFANPHSYRGYYCDLAFEPLQQKITASDALEMCCGCMGEVFTGWKGGEYMMGANTPIWLSHEGTCGVKIVALYIDGTLVTKEDD